MPIDPRVYVDGIGDTNVHDALHRALGAVHDRLLLLESKTGANPQVQVDSPTSPPPPQNPPPQNPAGLNVQFNGTTGFYTVTVTAPWNVQPQSGTQTSAEALQTPPVGVTPTYHLESSSDPTFQTNVTDYGVGGQHLFTVSGSAGLYFRVATSIDGGQNFGEQSKGVNVLD